jgi:hypothetical protein
MFPFHRGVPRDIFGSERWTERESWSFRRGAGGILSLVLAPATEFWLPVINGPGKSVFMLVWHSRSGRSSHHPDVVCQVTAALFKRKLTVHGDVAAAGNLDGGVRPFRCAAVVSYGPACVTAEQAQAAGEVFVMFDVKRVIEA